MKKVTTTGSRKADHIRINLEEKVESALTTGLEDYRFIHEALPELDLIEIDLSTSIFGRAVGSPLFISSMTGGTEQAARINRNLALAAQKAGIAVPELYGISAKPSNLSPNARPTRTGRRPRCWPTYARRLPAARNPAWRKSRR